MTKSPKMLDRLESIYYILCSIEKFQDVWIWH
jgi:hypothetical protein